MSELHPDDQLLIERLGGLAGVGLPGSHIRSRAVLACKAMGAEESRCVAALFAAPPPAGAAAGTGADGFRYRLTLRGKNSSREIEVAEAALLPSLQQRVQDELV